MERPMSFSQSRQAAKPPSRQAAKGRCREAKGEIRQEEQTKTLWACGVGAMHENEIAKEAVDAALKVHKSLGPGLLESVYEITLAYELRRRGFEVKRQQPVPIVYDSLRFEEGFRYDLLIHNLLLIEVKAVESVVDVHKRQLLTYLRLMDKRLGLLINFDVPLIRDGITRVVNGLKDDITIESS
jgi:GxxExxY protein